MCGPSDKLCEPLEAPRLDAEVLATGDEAGGPGVTIAADGNASMTAEEQRALPDPGKNASEEHRRDDEHRQDHEHRPGNGTPREEGNQTRVPCSDDPTYTDGCPDLVVDPNRMDNGRIVTETFAEDDCNVVEGHVPPGERRLLRFTYTTPNLGDGDLIVGAPANNTEWFEWSDCHEHYHYTEYADYRLWTVEGYARWQAARASMPDATPEEIFEEHPDLEDAFIAGHKQGFCVIDIRRYGSTDPRGYTSCSDNQGISVGWADEYGWWLDGQWIDITGVPAGDYVLEAESNPERLFQESNYMNNAGAVLVDIPEP